jgi:DNA-binding transcriptional MerR regulator
MVCAIAEVAPSTLNYWVRTELVAPSLLPSQGKRVTRWWSIPDLVTVRTVKALREAGCPLQTVRQAKDQVEKVWEDTMPAVVLYWDGADIIALEKWGTLRSAISHPGQQMFHLVALPVSKWHKQAEQSAVDVDLADVRERLKRIPPRRPTGTQSLRPIARS